MALSIETKLLQYVNEHQASYAGTRDQLVTQIHNRASSQNGQFLAELATHLQSEGLQVQVLNQQFLCAELKAEAPQTLLFYHSYAPHSTGNQELVDVAALLAALDVYKTVSGSVPINIKWLIDKSGTMQHAETQHKELKTWLQADAGIWYHAPEEGLESHETPLLALGTRGQLRVELEVQTTDRDIASMHGAVAPNALWRLLWALGSLKDSHEDILIEGFYDALTPVQDDVAEQLYTLPDSTTEMLQRWGIQQTLMGLQGFQLHYTHLLLPTCSVSGIMSIDMASEQEGTMLPGRAKAQIDLYLVPDQKAQDIFDKLQSHLQNHDFADVRLKVLSAYDPVSISANNRFVQHIIASTEKIYEKTPYVLPTTLGNYVAPFLRSEAEMPVIFISRNEDIIKSEKENVDRFGRIIKQIVLAIEGIRDATDTTQ